MRWHKNLPIAALVALAVAVVTAGAFGHPAAKKNGGVKGKIHKGTLTVTGTKGDDTLTLALRAGDPNTLVVSTGAGDLNFDSSQFDNVVVNAGKGSDTLTVDDLSGAAVGRVTADLGAGDGQADRVVVNGTTSDDVITVTGSTGSATVGGLAATVLVTGAQAADDTLSVEALGGDDIVAASALAADAISFSADGGANNDVLIGGAGDDVLSGGDGDDFLFGGPGLDTLDGGPGNNVVIQ